MCLDLGFWTIQNLGYNIIAKPSAGEGSYTSISYMHEGKR